MAEVAEMRRPLIVANWKMNKNVSEARDFVERLLKALPPLEDREVAICPSFVALGILEPLLLGSSVELGAQNMFPKEAGAYTGEISPKMLLDTGCSYVILGHSERRRYSQESDSFINEKVQAALAHSLRPILCVGETLAQREAGQAIEVVTSQLKAGFLEVPQRDAAKVVLAYEPVWAIGTGHTATPNQANEMHEAIRITLREMYAGEIAEAVRILYGGSVRPDNIDALMACPQIDGALVGGASLEVESFLRIVNFKADKQ